MNMDNFNKWLMLAANLGVLAGVIFLAIEIRQNNEFAENEAVATRYFSSIEAYNKASSNGELAEILVKSSKGEPLSEVETFRLTLLWRQTQILNQWSFLSLPEEQYRPYMEVQKANNRFSKLYRQEFESFKYFYDPEYVKYMEKNVFIEN